MANKHKIINDPVFGFIQLESDLQYDVVQHPYVQRLSRIRQLGLSNMVYPGAMHSRFLHSIGAMHLMSESLRCLRQKGVSITEQEAISASASDPWNQLHIAMGLVIFSPDSDASLNDTINRADEIMYENKRIWKESRKQ